jgi:hypothetical protein
MIEFGVMLMVILTPLVAVCALYGIYNAVRPWYLKELSVRSKEIFKGKVTIEERQKREFSIIQTVIARLRGTYLGVYGEGRILKNSTFQQSMGEFIMNALRDRTLRKIHLLVHHIDLEELKKGEQGAYGKLWLWMKEGYLKVERLKENPPLHFVVMDDKHVYIQEKHIPTDENRGFLYKPQTFYLAEELSRRFWELRTKYLDEQFSKDIEETLKSEKGSFQKH